MEKLQREAGAFANEVVRTAASFPQLVIASTALRAGYARLVAAEVFRVIEGKSQPQATREDEPMQLDVTAYQQGVPELVAAELVRDVVEPKEFHEFCHFDCLTVLNGDKYYRIPRRPHGLIEVWEAKTRKPLARLCVDERCGVADALAVLHSAGTDPRYQGLFQSVREFRRPTAQELAALPGPVRSFWRSRICSAP